MGGLICHQRGANETVPGCLGGEIIDRETDFCILNPSGSGYVDPPTAAPTVSMTSTIPTFLSSTSFPVAVDGQTSASPSFFSSPAGPSKEVWNRGWEPAFKLGECEGDCDEDSDCLPGLVCFQREGSLEAVPGCLAGEKDESLTDYCVFAASPDSVPAVDLPGSDGIGSVETPSPTTSSTTASSTPPVTTVDSAIPLNPVGWSPPAAKKPLGRCEGDCDDDSDCDVGLVCFQRFLPMAEVPGCLGGTEDTSLMDFCIDDPNSSASSLSDSEAPTAVTFSPAPSKTDPEAPISATSPSNPEAPTSPPPAPSSVTPPVDNPTAPVSVPTDTLVTEAPSLVDFPDAPTSTDDVVDDVEGDGSVPPPIDCQSYKDQGVNMNRICKPDPYMCCQVPRSSSNYCHEIYPIFGDDMESACYHCCMEEEIGEPLLVGPANDPHPNGLAPYDSCDELDNTSRLCKDQGCCDAESSETEYCLDEWASHIGDVERICWSCCFPSKLLPEPNARKLMTNGVRSGDILPISSIELLSTLEEKVDYENTQAEDTEEGLENPLHTAMTEEEMRSFHKNNPPELRSGDRVFEHTSTQRKLIVRKENFTPKGGKDEDAYFEEIHSAFQRRELQVPIMENYEDVHWWPYEWLLKVGTEYYFRYEGSMTVPPCFTVNHWRVMKDPIRVAKHQIQELERLLAWRLNGDCDASTAGKPRDGNPDAVDVNRPLQELEKGHRMVFCECQDWPSKFPKEREWCEKWQTRDPELRLYDNPYNWAQPGF
jgi:hypothetical protein